METAEIVRRLRLLAQSLAGLPAAVPCAAPVARIFNELLKHAKRAVPEDPILRGIKPVPPLEDDPETSSANAGTLLTLITQVEAALDNGD